MGVTAALHGDGCAHCRGAGVGSDTQVMDPACLTIGSTTPDCLFHYATPLCPGTLRRWIDQHEVLCIRPMVGVRTCAAAGTCCVALSDAVFLCAAEPLPLLPSLQPSDTAPEPCKAAAGFVRGGAVAVGMICYHTAHDTLAFGPAEH
jgi:hypothetical protein